MVDAPPPRCLHCKGTLALGAGSVSQHEEITAPPVSVTYHCLNPHCLARYCGKPPALLSLVPVRYRVSLDGAAGPEVELFDPPVHLQTIQQGPTKMVVNSTSTAVDGSLVINASRK